MYTELFGAEAQKRIQGLVSSKCFVTVTVTVIFTETVTAHMFCGKQDVWVAGHDATKFCLCPNIKYIH
jgi:hypothetical protein